MNNSTAIIKNQGMEVSVSPDKSNSKFVEFLIDISGPGIIQPMRDMRLTVQRDNGVSSAPTPNSGLANYLRTLGASSKVDVGELSNEIIDLCQEEAQKKLTM